MQSFETHGMSLLFSRHIFIYFQHSHVFGERGGCYNLTPSDVCIVVLCCELFANPYSFSTDRHNPTQTVYMLHSTNTIYTYINMCLQAVCRHVCFVTVDTWIDVPFFFEIFFHYVQKAFKASAWIDSDGQVAGRCDM